MEGSIYDYLDRYINEDGKERYRVFEEIRYYSTRYNKWVVAKVNDDFDGATGALDINSFGWIIHDVLCRDGYFEGGTKCNNWQASSVLSDILKEENRWFRARSWFVATWLFGGGKARKNGMTK